MMYGKLVNLDILETYNTVHLNDYMCLMPSEIAFGFFRIGSEWFLKFGSDRIRTGSFRIGSDSDFKIYQLSDWELLIQSDAHLLVCTAG